jgi:serine/threonine-protein kinase
LYHLLTGQPPFPDKNIINQMVRHATETPKPLQHFNPAIPDGLQQILNYMIAKQPDRRYPHPERAAQALQMFLMAESHAPAPDDEPPQMRQYLTWLETAPSEPETSQATPTPRTGASAHPLGVLDSLPAARPSPAPAAATRSADRKKHKKHRRRRGVPIAQPAPPIYDEAFDVELVPLAGNVPLASQDALVSGKTFGLSAREWVLVGMGALALAGAVAIGVVIALVLKP